ncbi:MAG: hypothetical protein ACR2RE_11615 [Geminicoccaceae bacterium]
MLKAGKVALDSRKPTLKATRGNFDPRDLAKRPAGSLGMARNAHQLEKLCVAQQWIADGVGRPALSQITAELGKLSGYSPIICLYLDSFFNPFRCLKQLV